MACVGEGHQQLQVRSESLRSPRTAKPSVAGDTQVHAGEAQGKSRVGLTEDTSLEDGEVRAGVGREDTVVLMR